jgi:hypothetical protein
MRTQHRSRTPILSLAIVVGVLAFTAGYGGDHAGILAAPPQLKALLLSCHQERQPYALTLLAPSGRTRNREARAIDEDAQLVATALLQDGSTRAVVLTPAGCN